MPRPLDAEELSARAHLEYTPASFKGGYTVKVKYPPRHTSLEKK